MKSRMKIKVLIVGYEIAPFYKCGGLGDVMGSLPKALRQVGVDARAVVPYYQEISSKFEEKKIGEFHIHFGSKEEQVSVYEGFSSEKRVPIYFLSNRPNLSHISHWGRNKKIDQFAFFDLAVVHLAQFLKNKGKWVPNLIHCNDWQSGLIPLLSRKHKLNTPTLLSIHNLAYQGWGSRNVLNLLHIKDEDLKELKCGVKVSEINLLGEGIMHANFVSTVSKTYAFEISNGENRDPIHLLIQKRKKERRENGKISGILNGIDYDVWNPNSDRFINQYDKNNWQAQKEKNKKELLTSLGLDDRPTFCFIGRIDMQKGLDVIVKCAKRIVSLNINLVILGSGDPNIERSIKRTIQKCPLQIKAEFVYSEELAHKLYGSSDFILVPSHYEPCGLIQMIAMRYGTLPIASRTGGLKDSIKNNINGFLFEKDSTRSFVKTFKKALRIYQNSQKYKKMVERAMSEDFSWRKSARRYKKLYLEILKKSSLISLS